MVDEEGSRSSIRFLTNPDDLHVIQSCGLGISHWRTLIARLLGGYSRSMFATVTPKLFADAIEEYRATAAEGTRDIAEAEESDPTLNDEVEMAVPEIKPDLDRLESKWDTHLSALGNRLQEKFDALQETNSRIHDEMTQRAQFATQTLEAANRDIDTTLDAK